MTGIAVLFAQLAAPAVTQTLPDIEIRARVRAERVEVKQQGAAKLELRVDPGEAEPVRVERSAPPGQTRNRNLTITLVGEARIADPRVSTTADARTEEPTGEPE